jgi:hypothetical protein
MGDKKHKMGRPLKFETPEDLLKAIQGYIDVTKFEELSVTGLALAIGTSRETLDDYQDREGYKEIVREAKLFVEHSYEMSLRKHGRSGDIFALKNFGWSDRQQIDHSLINNPALDMLREITGRDAK